MIVINKAKKPRLFAVVFVIIFLFGLNIFNCMRNARLSEIYASFVCMTDHLNKTNLISFVVSENAAVKQSKQIEIFDIKSGKIIKTTESNTLIEQKGIHFLRNITGPYEKITGFPDEGYIIKIPFEQPAEIENKWLNSFGIRSPDGFFILFPKGEKPYLLVLDEKYRPFFFNFEGDTKSLLEDLDFEIQFSESGASSQLTLCLLL